MPVSWASSFVCPPWRLPCHKSRAAGKTSGLQGQEERIWPFTETPRTAGTWSVLPARAPAQRGSTSHATAGSSGPSGRLKDAPGKETEDPDCCSLPRQSHSKALGAAWWHLQPLDEGTFPLDPSVGTCHPTASNPPLYPPTLPTVQPWARCHPQEKIHSPRSRPPGSIPGGQLHLAFRTPRGGTTRG